MVIGPEGMILYHPVIVKSPLNYELRITNYEWGIGNRE
jgi:hypothetical protein